MEEIFAHEDDWGNHPKTKLKIELSENIKEYDTMLRLDIEKLEVFARDMQIHAINTTNLQERYKAWNSAKRILKITELIEKEKESNEQ